MLDQFADTDDLHPDLLVPRAVLMTAQDKGEQRTRLLLNALLLGGKPPTLTLKQPLPTIKSLLNSRTCPGLEEQHA